MKNSKILETLSNCIHHCNYCASACLEEDDVNAMANCIKVCGICGSVCASLANVLATNYKEVNGLLHYCEQLCEHCARECEKHSMDHCLACAKACKQCEEACGTFSA